MVTSESSKDLADAAHDDRANVRRLVATSQWHRAEPDKLRLANFVGRTGSSSTARIRSSGSTRR